MEVEKCIGLVIGKIVILFNSNDDRRLAINEILKGNIYSMESSTGSVYSSSNSITLIESITNLNYNKCISCYKDFPPSICYNREYPYVYNDNHSYFNDTNYICENCYDKAIEKKLEYDKYMEEQDASSN